MWYVYPPRAPKFNGQVYVDRVLHLKNTIIKNTWTYALELTQTNSYMANIVRYRIVYHRVASWGAYKNAINNAWLHNST